MTNSTSKSASLPSPTPKIMGVEVSKMRKVYDEELAKGKELTCNPVKNKGKIIAWDFPTDTGDVVRVGPLMFPWIPHEQNTWPHIFMTTKIPFVLNKWNQKHPVDENTTAVTLPAGTRVRIVMVSRFGDVGITDDLTATHGYHARVMIDDLQKCFDNFSMIP